MEDETASRKGDKRGGRTQKISREERREGQKRR